MAYSLRRIVEESIRLSSYRPWRSVKGKRGCNRHYRESLRNFGYLYNLSDVKHRRGDRRVWVWDTEEEAKRAEECMWEHRAGQRTNQYEAEVFDRICRKLPDTYIVKQSQRTKRDNLIIPHFRKNLEYDIVIYSISDPGKPIAFVEVDGGTHFFPSCYLKNSQAKVEALKGQLKRDNIKNNYWSRVSFFARIPVMCFADKDELDTVMETIIGSVLLGVKGLYLARSHMYSNAIEKYGQLRLTV